MIYLFRSNTVIIAPPPPHGMFFFPSCPRFGSYGWGWVSLRYVTSCYALSLGAPLSWANCANTLWVAARGVLCSPCRHDNRKEFGETMQVKASKEGIAFSVQGDMGTGNVLLKPRSAEKAEDWRSICEERRCKRKRKSEREGLGAIEWGWASERGWERLREVERGWASERGCESEATAMKRKTGAERQRGPKWDEEKGTQTGQGVTHREWEKQR